MTNRRLLFKDISAMRFVGMFFLFAYIIVFMLSNGEEPSVYSAFLPLVDTLKNLSISLFFVVSSFLLTAHGLRAYKYNNAFNLKNFYIRRVIRILPVLVLVILFYFIVHPQLIEFLKIAPTADRDIFYNLAYLPRVYNTIDKDVLIYLFCIYGVMVLAQYYFIWGIILKFLKPYLKWVLVLFFIIGLVFKFSDHQVNTWPLFMYLPYYFTEIAVGAFTAYIIRAESPIITRIKQFTSSQLFYIYISVVVFSIGTYVIQAPLFFDILAKVFIYLLIGFYIIEQTYSRHSFFKARNSLFMTDLGNISYSYIMFAPIMAVAMLLTVELIEFNIGSQVIQITFPIICFALTWIFSSLYHHFVEKHILSLKKQFKY